MIEGYLGCYRVVTMSTPVVGERLLLVGEDNPVSDDPQFALYPYPPGCAGERLATKIFGVWPATTCATWRTNLCNPYWSMKAARERARELLEITAPWKTIVTFGAKVAEAFRPFTTTANTKPVWEPFTRRYANAVTCHNMDCKVVVYLPHPSGRNRAWNVRGAPANARKLLGELVPDYPWGEALGR